MMRIGTAVFIIIGSLGMNVQALAQSSDYNVKTEAEKAAVAIEANLHKLKKTVTGTVRETDTGLILETEEGVYKLKGLSIKDISGKEVHVTGVVKMGKKENIIYVVKAGME